MEVNQLYAKRRTAAAAEGRKRFHIFRGWIFSNLLKQHQKQQNNIQTSQPESVIHEMNSTEIACHFPSASVVVCFSSFFFVYSESFVACQKRRKAMNNKILKSTDESRRSKKHKYEFSLSTFVSPSK